MDCDGTWDLPPCPAAATQLRPNKRRLDQAAETPKRVKHDALRYTPVKAEPGATNVKLEQAKAQAKNAHADAHARTHTHTRTMPVLPQSRQALKSYSGMRCICDCIRTCATACAACFVGSHLRL